MIVIFIKATNLTICWFTEGSSRKRKVSLYLSIAKKYRDFKHLKKYMQQENRQMI